jgi:transcription antitermination factor NusB
MGSRRRARELAVQVLFCLEFLDEEASPVFDRVCDHFSRGKPDRTFARELVLGTCERKKEIDRMIRQSSRNWRLERMSRLDRSILRMAVFEILHRDDVPPKVSIDEAVELGKQFGNAESGKFINGILDDIFNTVQGNNAAE